jgi:uncharacterized PurR-regulated membrane protein YhhQ (DUF165 family)
MLPTYEPYQHLTSFDDMIVFILLCILMTYLFIISNLQEEYHVKIFFLGPLGSILFHGKYVNNENQYIKNIIIT